MTRTRRSKASNILWLVAALSVCGTTVAWWTVGPGLGLRGPSTGSDLSENARSPDSPPALPVSDSVRLLRSESSTPAQIRHARNSLVTHADGGDAQAMYLLALSARGGLGETPDLAQAFHWFQRAANQGNSAAMVRMAEYHAQGVWVEQNARARRAWLEKAAALGNAEARQVLEEEMQP